LEINFLQSRFFEEKIDLDRAFSLPQLRFARCKNDKKLEIQLFQGSSVPSSVVFVVSEL